MTDRLPISDLALRLGVKFNSEQILQQAVVHRSYLNEHPDFALDHNERLEFLGDAVLELVVTEYLYTNYPNPEGELTNWRASLVNGTHLATIGKELGIESYILMSRGEAKDQNSKARQYILANAMEALIGAMYLDSGIATASEFIHRTILVTLPGILEQRLYVDAKSAFQERAQDQLGITPTYKVISSSGPDHAKTFNVGVYLERELIATGTGSSKQEAQTEAARQGLATKGWTV